MDWGHFGLMGYGWWLWLNQTRLASNLSMPSAFSVLQDPHAEARITLTNAQNEFTYLAFSNHVGAMIDNWSRSNAITSMCGKYQFEHAWVWSV